MTSLRAVVVVAGVLQFGGVRLDMPPAPEAVSGPATTARRVLRYQAPAGSGQSPDALTTDATLEDVSLGRTVRVGSLSGGEAPMEWPLEVYLARVLAGEAEAGAGDAAQEALAIAARTFTVANLRRHARLGFDLCDTTHCQVSREPSASARRAVLATAGLVLTYRGRPADVFYSASCGGQTERAADVWARGAAFPYLRGVPDDVHGNDPVWRLERSLDEIQSALVRVGFRGERLENVHVEARSSSGRAMRVGVPGLEPGTLTGDDLRAALGYGTLRSTAFSIERSGDRVVFEGRGYGHGVGMCVVGANRRAKRGEGAEAILKQYFPALDLASLNDLAVPAFEP